MESDKDAVTEPPQTKSLKSVRKPSAFRWLYKWVILLICITVSNIVLTYGCSRWDAPMHRVVRVAGETTPAPGPTLRLAAYNIAHGRGSAMDADNQRWQSSEEVKDHLAKIAEQVRLAQIDILVLNEADFRSSWSFRVNQAEVLSESTGLTHRLQQRNMEVALPWRKYAFGNAILSRYPIVDFAFIKFPPLSGLENAVAGNHDGCWADIQTPDGTLRVFAIHLEYRDEATRVACAEILNQQILSAPHPVVLLGDFNSAPSFCNGHNVAADGQNAVDLLWANGLTSPEPEAGWGTYLTFPSLQPSRAIDWILTPSSVIRTHSGGKFYLIRSPHDLV